MDERIDLAIEKGLNFLESAQAANGSFPTLTSNNIRDFQSATSCDSNFASAIIYLCLKNLPGQKASLIKKRIVSYIKGQRSDDWTFNYWDRNSQFNNILPYPDDLDDTACSLAALFLDNEDVFTGNVFGKIASALTSLEVTVGGPYKTWFVADDAPPVWRDIDLAVNSNVAYFLALTGISLPKISKYVSQQIIQDNICSPYYPTHYPVYYFISRFYKGKEKKKLTEKLLQLKNTQPKSLSTLDQALYVLVSLNLHLNHKTFSNEVEQIINTQEQDGSWQLAAFYAGINPTKNHDKYFEGSAALTTAFCIEAMLGYKFSNIKTKTSRDMDTKKEVLKNETLREFLSVFDQKDLTNAAVSISNRISKSQNGDEAILLPYFFAESLKPGYKKKISRKEIKKLCLANLFGWTAYTIYDDVYDNETKPELLPIANISLRKLTAIYSNEIMSSQFFSEYFINIMNSVDSANFEEICHYRLKIENQIITLKERVNFGNKNADIAKKSLGHTLGPIYILNQLGCGFEDMPLLETEKLFLHYITAKQLNDDAHDWEDDLKNGRLTPVVELIFSSLKTTQIDINQIDEIRELFWEEIILEVCATIRFHLQAARTCYSKIPHLKANSPITDMLNRLEQTLAKTIQERQKAKDFISSYLV